MVNQKKKKKKRGMQQTSTKKAGYNWLGNAIQWELCKELKINHADERVYSITQSQTEN